MGENYTRLAIITVQLVVKKKTLTNVQLPEFGTQLTSNLIG